MTKQSNEGGGESLYTSDLGRSNMMDLVLQTLVDEGKLESLAKVRAPRSETMPVPRSDEVVVFVAFLDAGLPIPCIELVFVVLWLYRVESAQLTPNSIPKARCQMYVPTPAARNLWEMDWTRRWFYHTCLGKDDLQSWGGLIQLTATPEIVLTSREEALIHLLLDTMKRLSTRDLVELFCAFGVWPLANEWRVELGALKFGFPVLTMEGREVAPIAEAVRVVELLLGPYTGEEHVKRRLVHPDPDAGKKKHARVPKVKGAGPIAATPLLGACPRDTDGPTCSAEDTTKRLTKRVAEGTPKRVECSKSSSSSSDERAISPVEGAEAEDIGHTMSEVDKAIGTFGVTRLAVEESSSMTPRRAFMEGASKSSGMPPATPRSPVVVSDGGGKVGGGGSASAGSEEAPSLVSAPAAMGAVDLGPLCHADFKVSEGTAGVCEAVADFTAPPLVWELFQKTSLKDMFQSVETNAVKKRVNVEHAQSRALSIERDSLAKKMKTLDARVVGLEAEHTALQGNV
uniref:PH01B001E05.4 protein n=1 Tax=Phyllostachys edulis TaxID=38705 RepID=L0P3Z6_PHYED|nr:PH01B001E05.4 [Phyllostachys edulis]